MALSRRAQNRLLVAGAIAVLLLGAALIAYPFVSNALLVASQGKVLSVQQDAVAAAPADDLAAAREFALNYNADLRNSRTVVTDPFDPAAQRPQTGAYERALNIAGDGVMGTVVIPAIDVMQPIYHTVDDDVLQKGVGHLEETSLPIGGTSSHCVLSGHTGLPSGKIFDDLDRLAVGDYFVLQVLGEDHAYRIYDIETVLPDETQSLVIQPGRDLCTLVTCTPYGVNSHRLLVHAERCELPAAWLERDKAAAEPGSGGSLLSDRTVLPAALIGVAVAAVLIGGTVAVRRVRARRSERGDAAAAWPTVRAVRPGVAPSPRDGSDIPTTVLPPVAPGAAPAPSATPPATPSDPPAYRGRHFREP